MGIATEAIVWRRNAYRPRTLNVNGTQVERREFGSGIATSVDVMARFGLLMLRGGMWKGTRILDASYVTSAATHQQQLSGLPCYGESCVIYPPTEEYSLLWWTNADGSRPGTPLDAFEALGLGTSFILVIPSLDIVVARAGPAWVSPAGTSAVSPFYALVAGAVNGAAASTNRGARGRSDNRL